MDEIRKAIDAALAKGLSDDDVAKQFTKIMNEKKDKITPFIDKLYKQLEKFSTHDKPNYEDLAAIATLLVYHSENCKANYDELKGYYDFIVEIGPELHRHYTTATRLTNELGFDKLFDALFGNDNK